MNNKDQIRHSATIRAIDARINRLIYGVPLAIIGGTMGYAIAGTMGALGIAVIGIYTIKSTFSAIADDKEAIAHDKREVLLKYTPKPDRDKLREVYAAAVEQPAPAVEEPTTPLPAPTSPAPGKWSPVEFSRQELLDSSTGILLLGNSGSGKTTLAQYLCQGMAAPVLVLDPHYDPNIPAWGPAMVIKDKDMILAAMEWLMDLLERGDKRPLCVVADEYPSIRLHAIDRKSKVADKFIIKYGSEGRKYNKFSLFCSQSGNVKSLGLSGQGDFVENFTLIRLGKIATKDAQNRPNRDKYNWLCNTAYALTVNSHDAALHPNLGHHPQVIKGVKPENLEAFNPPPLYPDVTQALSQRHITPSQTHHTADHSPPPPHPITSQEDCPHRETVSNGTSPTGVPRRRCKSCGKTFDAPPPADPLMWGV